MTTLLNVGGFLLYLTATVVFGIRMSARTERARREAGRWSR
jgi:hypothetical protein